MTTRFVLLLLTTASLAAYAGAANSSTVYRVGPTGDFKSCHEAIDALKPYEGATILIEPGTRDDYCGGARAKGNIVIRGIRDAQGKRPTIRVPMKSGHPRSFFTFIGLPENPARPEETANLLIEDLIITGQRAGQERPSMNDGITVVHYAKAVFRNLEISYATENCIEGSRPSAESGYDYRVSPKTGWNHRIEIHDTVVHHCGDGSNLRHNIYVQPHELLVDNLWSYDSVGGHVLKVVPRVFAEVRNSRLETTLSATPDASQILSTTLLDIGGCALEGTHIHNNTFVHYYRREEGSATGAAIIDYRRRKSVNGCDNPPYGSKEFRDPHLWQQVVAWGLSNPNNTRLFRHFVWNNTFIERSPLKGHQQTIAVRNNGTFPIESTTKPNAGDLPAPAGWVERSAVFVSDNKLVNIPTPYVERGTEKHPAPIVLNSECKCFSTGNIRR